MRLKASGDWQPNGCVSPPELSEPIPLNSNTYLGWKIIMFNKKET
ncbi:hypothetical protein [Glaciecola sp. MH2013]|nr:hypothetical protein [Glaciecola sp. MH2013]